MAVTINTCTIKATHSCILTNALDLSTPDDSLSLTFTMSLTGGSGVGKGNEIWHDQRTLATAANDDLDLAGGLTDAFGQSIVFTTVRYLAIRNTSTTDTLLVGGGSDGAGTAAWSTPFGDASDKLRIRMAATSTNTAWWQLPAPDATGYVVTAGTADILRIAHEATTSASVVYDIVIIGEVA